MAVGLTVALLHSFAGLAWPLGLGMLGTAEMSMPALGYLPAEPPADPERLELLLQRDLVPALPPEMGVVIGVIQGGRRRTFVYGTAREDSIYQIASISKTFTSLALAQMASEGTVRLDEPLRELLPKGAARQPGGPEITLLDLATHRSGLPPMPDNVSRESKPNPGAEYRPEDLYAFIARHGIARPDHPPFSYSNAGYALLGQALADRAGVPYRELIARRITAPLGMRDTAIDLSGEQRQRVIPAYSVRGELREPWQIGALAPAGGICTTAGDMLTYLDAHLAAPSDALRLVQQRRGQVAPGMQIALAWMFDEDSATYWHNGAISAYTSHALFSPRDGYAVVVLVNQAISLVTFADLVAQHTRDRLRGRPAVSLASVVVPTSGGISGVARLFGAYWLTMIMAGAFVYGCVLVLQGLAAQLLPRRVFLRISSLLQLAVFCAVVCVYLLQPMAATGRTLISANGAGPLAWSPSYWFLGLLQQLNGSPALSLLARRAWIATATVMGLATATFLMSYFRTLRRVVEEPDIVPGARGGIWLPPFGGPALTALVQFSVRTLMRSRLHRLILAFYWGLAFAYLIVLLRTAPGQAADAPFENTWGRAYGLLFTACAVTMALSSIGTRVIFSIPLDLRANWMFRVTAVRQVSECLAAARRSLLLLSAAPVCAVSAVVYFRFSSPRAALAHLAVLMLVSLVIVELSLLRFEKIPFTCSYLPGKSQLHMAILGTAYLLWVIRLNPIFEREVLQRPAGLAAFLLVLALVWGFARWRNAVHAGSLEAEVRFEEADDPAVQELGLSRDGSWPVNPTVLQ
jgi:CubicO group peptidase (beta-lactamase class C family)